MNDTNKIERVSLAQPDRLLLDGQYHGGDQDWYVEEWHKRAGCGPTTAAGLLYYLAQRDETAHVLWPTAGTRTREDYLNLMDQVWHDVTPGARGLNRSEMFVEGVERFALRKAVSLIPHILHIHESFYSRKDFDAFSTFIRSGLRADCPVAFLNLSNGKLKNLHNWHWVPIVEAGWQTGDSGETEELTATILDETKSLEIDLKCWYETSWLGGALVWFSRP